MLAAGALGGAGVGVFKAIVIARSIRISNRFRQYASEIEEQMKSS